MKLRTGSLWRNIYTRELRKQYGKPPYNHWDIRRSDLFGFDPEEGIAGDLYCFTMGHYVYFLDNVLTKEDLVEGLFELSPFADDALQIAFSMSYLDFAEFKLTLAGERRSAVGGGKSRMPNKFASLLLPNRFPAAILLAEMARTSMGLALIRIMETELGM